MKGKALRIENDEYTVEDDDAFIRSNTNNAFIVSDNNSNNAHGENNIDNSRCNVNSLRVNLYDSSSDLLPSNIIFQNYNIKISPTESIQEKEKLLLHLRSSYAKGLNYFCEGNYALAEAEFVKVLKPALSKPVMQSLYISVEDCKEVALDAMYHLGKIYLNSPQYFNNYAKAAGIFQYCTGFAEKYKLKLKAQIQNNSKEGVSFNGSSNENYNNDNVDFLKDAYLVEERFLESIGRGNIGVSDNNNLPSYQSPKIFRAI